jgi:GTPase SAR1 family protein
MMKKPIAILVAGHSNWGKSATLKALTEGRLFRSYQLSGADFFIRRMSNDDYTEAYKDFIDECVAAPSGNILAAFCPHFETGDLRFSEHSLAQLQTRYDLYIFALKYQYHTDNRITDHELTSMARFGEVRIFDDQNAESEDRAVALEDYIATIFNR